MATPHFDAVIDALSQPWYFTESKARATAAAQARTYATILTDEFNKRGDKEAIDSALGLGAYLVHSEANKRKRLALRAVLLADVLMKKRPASDIAHLRPRYESLAFDALKRALINLFPLMQGDANRAFWAPDFFTDPILLPDLRIQEDWRNKPVPPYMFIVHASDNPAKPLWQDPVGEIAKYSGSSMSLISNQKPYVYSASGMVQGVIFRVPAKNILITYHADIMTTLHAGTVHKPAMGKTLAEEILELAAASGAISGGLATPTTLLGKTGPARPPSVGMPNGSNYNEIVVCGKAGVPLPWGVTENLKLVGFFMFTTKDGKLLQPFDAPARLTACEAHAKRLKRPLLFLPHVP